MVPFVSLIIPTYNRLGPLQTVLGTCAVQTWPQDCFEVLVVDDGSTLDLQPVLAGAQLPNLKYICQSNQGSAVARNTGAEHSRGDILIFIDDDMLLEPGYIQGLVHEHQQNSHIVGMGACFPYPDAAETTFARVYAQILSAGISRTESVDVDFTACVTNNLSVERQDFFEIGQMQDIAGDGPTWWGDIDFGYRAARLGYRFRRSAAAICYHNDYSIQNLQKASQRCFRASELVVLLFQRYPELQNSLSEYVDKFPIRLSADSPRLVANKLFHVITSQKPVLKAMEVSVMLFEKGRFPDSVLRPLYRWILSSYLYWGYRQGLRRFGSTGKSA